MPDRASVVLLCKNGKMYLPKYNDKIESGQRRWYVGESFSASYFWQATPLYYGNTGTVPPEGTVLLTFKSGIKVVIGSGSHIAIKDASDNYVFASLGSTLNATSGHVWVMKLYYSSDEQLGYGVRVEEILPDSTNPSGTLSRELYDYFVVGGNTLTYDHPVLIEPDAWNYTSYSYERITGYIPTVQDKELFEYLLLGNEPIVFPGETSTETDPNNPTGEYQRLIGTYNDTSDSIPVPATPGGTVNLGLYRLYAPTYSQVNNLARWLWDENGFDVSQWKRLLQDPMECIISLSLFPFSTASETTEHIVFGGIESPVDANVAVSQYQTIDCGKVKIEPFYGSVLDFSPYTSIQLVLPYVGSVPLDVDEVMGYEVGIKYTVDLLTGMFVAFVTVEDNVMYQFPGNMANPVPVTGGSFIENIKGVTQVAVGAFCSFSGGLGSSPVSAGAQMVAQTAMSGVAAMKQHVNHTGAMTSSTGYLGVRKPYLIINYPNQALAKDYAKLSGYPSQITDKLSNFSGYTVVAECHLEEIGCTASERDMIDQLLKGGVIINTNPNRVEVDGLTTYVLKSERAAVYKSLTKVETIAGDYRRQEDVTSVTIDILSTVEDFDYFYLSKTGRYYFVSGREQLRDGVIRITGTVDPLESFAAEILAQTALVTRNEKRFNLFLNDSMFVTYQNPKIKRVDFPDGLTGNGFILVTAGGEIAI